MRDFIDRYHILYEKERIWEKNEWFSVPCYKLPFDMIIIQELIYKTKPDFILETGTGCGGSAMFYASICELLKHGRVITVDIDDRVPMDIVDQHEWSNRITWLIGDSTGIKIADEVMCLLKTPDPNCMVILDSWHGMDHVYREMFLYKELVPVGGYMIVEDSHAAGNPVPWKHDDLGPMGAIDKFLETEGDEWSIDKDCEKHLMTFNPKGYLKKIK